MARELCLKGHQVTILTNSPQECIRFKVYKYQNVNIVETPDIFWGQLRTGWDPLNVIRRCLYLKDKKYDVIHAFDTRPTVILPALFYKWKIKKIAIIIDWADWWGRGGAISLRNHKLLNTLFSPFETFFEEYFRRFADYTTVTSSALKTRATRLGLNKKFIKVIFSGADIRTIYPINKKNARKQLNLSQTAHVCIFPGFVLYDLQMVLNTFLLVRRMDPSAVLILIGVFPDTLGNDFEILKNLGTIRVLGITNKEKLRICLSAADVGILPLQDNIANIARFPIKFGDFLAAGLPVVTNDVGDIGYLTKKYKITIIADYSPQSMSKKILWVFKNPPKANEIGDRARSFAENKFSWEIIARQLLPIYEKLVSNITLTRVVRHSGNPD